MKRLSNWMPSWAWIIVIAALAQSVLAFSNRNVYSKDEVDVRVESLEDKIDWMHQDVRDIKRMLGGKHAQPNQDSNTSQPDS